MVLALASLSLCAPIDDIVASLGDLQDPVVEMRFTHILSRESVLSRSGWEDINYDSSFEGVKGSICLRATKLLGVRKDQSHIIQVQVLISLFR